MTLRIAVVAILALLATAGSARAFDSSAIPLANDPETGWPSFVYGDTHYSLTNRPARTLNTHRGERAAAEYWGRRACRAITWHRLYSEPVGMVGMDYATGPSAVVRPGCTVWLDPELLASPSKARTCTIIAHELGHLLGFTHADAGTARDPAGVMAATYSRALPACKRRQS